MTEARLALLCFGLAVLLFGVARIARREHDCKVNAVLVHLLLNGESYGLGMVRANEGVLSRGTVYVLLGSLEQQGLVSSRAEDWTPPHLSHPRCLYRLTGRGRVEALRRAGKGGA